MKKKRFIQNAALCFLLVLSLVLSDTNTTFAENNETGENVENDVENMEEEIIEIEISSLEELLNFAGECQFDAYSFGKVFSLTADIDLSGSEFNGIPYFEGIFKGNGHSISGVNMNIKGSDYGFFRYLGQRAVVQDLHVLGTVKMDGSAVNVGGFAGVNKGVISKCSFAGNVSGDTSAGGLVGCNKEGGMIFDCEVEGRVTATDITGGICGTNEGIIKGCTNSAKINDDDLQPTLDLEGVDLGSLNITQNVVTRNDMGGIAGISTGTIDRCNNKGNVGFVHVGYNIGGIVGRQSGTVMNCTNEGKILGRKDVGGIVGQAEPYMESEYLSDRLDKIKEDFNRMNNLVIQMSNALSSTSTSTKQYTQSLQQQYEDTIASLNTQVDSLKGTIAANNEQTRIYIENLSNSLENMGNIGNDTLNRMVESVGSELNSAIGDLKDEFESYTESRGDLPFEFPSLEHPSTEPSSSEQPSQEQPSLEQPSTEQPSSEQPSSEQPSLEQPSSEPAGGNTDAVSTPEPSEQPPADTETSSQAQQAEEPEGAIDTSGFENYSAVSTVTETDSGSSDESFTLPDLPESESIREEIENFELDPEIRNNLDRMQQELSSVTGNIKNMQGSLSNSTNSMSETAGNIANELEERSKTSGDTIDGMTNSIDSGIQSMTNSINGIMNTQQEITDYVSEDIDILMGNGDAIFDASSIDITENTLGVISGCTNQGDVEADINVGGIAGAMNLEYDIDPELDFDLSKFTEVAVRATVNNVVIHCISYGSIKAKKNNCGGIVGSEELGIIYDCEGYGNVKSDGGSRLGGIAGMSQSGISKCYSFCNVEGKDYLGGICGDAYNISDCISMSALISEEGEYSGSIAGNVNSEATVVNNYFVTSETGGIDNINYFGKAEVRTYEQIMEMEQIPKGFKTVTITFEKDEEIIGTMKLPYGGSLTEGSLPDVEVDEDAYLHWDQEFPILNVSDNITVQANEERWTLSVASAQKTETGKPYVLVEGRFYDNAVLKLADTQLPEEAENMEAAYAYGWEIENLPADVTDCKVHLLIPEGSDKAEVWVRDSGIWKMADAVEDGSYLVVQIPYGAAFAVYGIEDGSMLYYIIAAAAALVVLILILIIVKKKRRKKEGKK